MPDDLLQSVRNDAYIEIHSIDTLGDLASSLWPLIENQIGVELFTSKSGARSARLLCVASDDLAFGAELRWRDPAPTDDQVIRCYGSLGIERSRSFYLGRKRIKQWRRREWSGRDCLDDFAAEVAAGVFNRLRFGCTDVRVTIPALSHARTAVSNT